MTVTSERFVPKVHPAMRPVEPDDPMTLHATAVPGDPEAMLQCLIQEFVWMDWGVEQILEVFRDPYYPMLFEMWQHFGDDGLRRRLRELFPQTGAFRVKTTLLVEPEDEPKLIQLGRFDERER